MYPDYPAGAFQEKPGEKPRPNKARCRPAPYVLRPYTWHEKHSVGRGPAEQVVVYDFDPLLVSEAKIRTMLSEYGNVTESKNMTDPATGAYLGICVVKFGDKTVSERSAKAANSARQAEKDGNGKRVDQWPVRIERDADGVRSKRYAENKINKRKLELQSRLKEKPPTQPQALAASIVPPKGPKSLVAAPPPNAPKGPSMKAPLGPRPVVLPTPVVRTIPYSLVEQAPVLPSLGRAPYIFIAHCYVPVLGTTVGHLQKRMKSYQWEKIRCDKLGYYIIFKDSRDGRAEAERLFNGCNMLQLFNYTMNMDLQKHGNPDRVRSPTPERVAAEESKRIERRKIRQEDEADFEMEKQERARDLDPTRAALDRMKAEMLELMLVDIKTKQGTPHIHKLLDPMTEKNKATRQKFNIQEPTTADTVQGPLVRRPEGPRAQMVNSFRGGMRKFAMQRQEIRKNPYLDDRRSVARPRVRQPQALHQRLQDYDSDSDDERRTSVTRGSDGIDSRAISEAARSPARFEVDDDGHLTPHTKRQRTDRWGQDSDDESVDVAHKSLGSLVNKDLEEMSELELEKVLSMLKASDPIRKKALRELKHRRKALNDDRLFYEDTKDKSSVVDITVDDTDSVSVTATPEPLEISKAGKKKLTTKTKRKTKKQIQEDIDAAARAEMEAKLDQVIEQAEAGAEDDTEMPVAEDDEPHIARPEVEWGVSTTEPRRTVQDAFETVLDVDGWQHFVKDIEDLRLLKAISKGLASADLECDADLWSHNHKQFKSLNTGVHGVTKEHLEIPGYYIPNRTGCARTQPHTKIFEDEKSKYLPHRIKVKNLREQRQAEAKRTGVLDPLATAKAPVKQAAKLNSRANRVDNRHLQRDIALITMESDTFAMNALKKRKKCVRFDRSSIHGWGLYAEENIIVGEMIIEYVGEKIRQKVADVREVMYELQGVGSSYLFRIDDEHVIDATKKGGIARFINHSCMPNCTAKIIKVDGTKRIVIYALRDIEKGMFPAYRETLVGKKANLILLDEELTYDYKFEREMPDSKDRVPCLCSTVLCQGYLN
jgi:histone-lysine N-methyltransferase SETD1